MALDTFWLFPPAQRGVLAAGPLKGTSCCIDEGGGRSLGRDRLENIPWPEMG